MVCGYRLDLISASTNCPLCKASLWEDTKSGASTPSKAPQAGAVKPPTTQTAQASNSITIHSGSIWDEVKKLLDAKQYSQASVYLTKAADSGSPVAQYELGRLYQYGLGVKKDTELADELLCASASQEYIPAYVLLGKIRFQAKKYPSAWKWFLKAAEKNDPEAIYYTSVFYANGYHVGRNPKMATKAMEKALSLGSVDAHLHQANAADSKGDYVIAIKHFRFAADQENSEAQYYLGKYYAGGLGVTKDLLKAAYWYKKAADHGYSEASESLQGCVRAMSATQKIKWSTGIGVQP